MIVPSVAPEITHITRPFDERGAIGRVTAPRGSGGGMLGRVDVNFGCGPDS